MANAHGYATKLALANLLYTWTKGGGVDCPNDNLPTGR